ncbi:MAG: histidinol-phosphatase HisJ family protein [Clostridia bacterium]|nr:histidinol-phosphatase HisJ family protein [Clostridia bacterium]
MSIKCNLHTHTCFSDGKHTAEEVVLSAIDKGFQTIGFSDHGYAPLDSACMPEKDEPRYRAEILRLKEAYRDRIEVVLGYEHDASKPDSDLSPYSYVIESIHILEGRPVDWDKAHFLENAAGDIPDYVRRYYRFCAEVYAQSTADICGHINLIEKFNEGNVLFDPDAPALRTAAFDALDAALAKDMIIEINTGAMSRGYRTEPYPSPALLRRVKEKGGRICLSSDSHHKDTLDHAFDLAAALARDCGFTAQWVWHDGGFTETEL